MHKAAFLSSADNVKTLLELGASPNYRDPIGLTPLYYNMLTADSNDQVAEMLLREAADIGVTDMHGNHEIHQVGASSPPPEKDEVLPYKRTGWLSPLPVSPPHSLSPVDP